MYTVIHQIDPTIREKKCNVLIVEDNLAYRTAIKDLLTTRFPRMVLREAVTGKETLGILKSFSPQLVFLDIKLPDLNGLELIGKIKKRHGNAIVIILTACDSQGYRQQALHSGAAHFIGKGSTSLADILALVESIMADLTDLPIID